MKKQILTGMVAGAVFTVSAASLAQAQTVVPDSQQPGAVPQYGTPGVTTQQTTRIDPTQVGQPNTIVVGSSQMPPRQSVSTGRATHISVLNPSPRPVMFTVPALNASFEVAANSQRVIQITPDMVAALPQGQEVAYYITDADGNQLASNTITRDQELAYSYSYTQQSAVTQQAQDIDEQPAAASDVDDQPSTTQQRSTVRGYW